MLFGTSKRFSKFAILCFSMISIGCWTIERLPAQTAKPPAQPIVLIPPFENNSTVHQKVPYEVGVSAKGGRKTFMVDRLTEATRSKLETIVANIPGVTVVERKRLDSMLAESEYGAMSGLVDSDKAVKLGRHLGAHLLVMGTITDIREDKRTFKGFGIDTEQLVVKCSIVVRMITIETGVQSFNKEYTESKTYTKSTNGKSDSNDRAYASVELAIEAVGKDAAFKAALLGKDPEGVDTGSVEIEFAPKPDNCDIIIDGNYVGGSPLKRSLVTKKAVKIQIIKDGYKTWEGTIIPEKGLKITRELSAAQ